MRTLGSIVVHPLRVFEPREKNSVFDRAWKVCSFDRRKIAPVVGFLAGGCIAMTTASLLVIDYLNQMGIAYADPDNPDFNKFVESEKAALLLMETGMIGMGIGLISGIFTYYITDLIVS